MSGAVAIFNGSDTSVLNQESPSNRLSAMRSLSSIVCQPKAGCEAASVRHTHTGIDELPLPTRRNNPPHLFDHGSGFIGSDIEDCRVGQRVFERCIAPFGADTEHQAPFETNLRFGDDIVEG